MTMDTWQKFAWSSTWDVFISQSSVGDKLQFGPALLLNIILALCLQEAHMEVYTEVLDLGHTSDGGSQRRRKRRAVEIRVPNRVVTKCSSSQDSKTGKTDCVAMAQWYLAMLALFDSRPKPSTCWVSPQWPLNLFHWCQMSCLAILPLKGKHLFYHSQWLSYTYCYCLRLKNVYPNVLWEGCPSTLILTSLLFNFIKQGLAFQLFFFFFFLTWNMISQSLHREVEVKYPSTLT